MGGWRPPVDQVRSTIPITSTSFDACGRRGGAAGLTIKQVAKALGRPFTFVSKCELGERRIDPADLLKFAELYDKPIEYFYPRRRRQTRSVRRPNRE